MSQPPLTFEQVRHFLDMIARAPGDPLPRRVFAEWLEERGYHEEAKGRATSPRVATGSAAWKTSGPSWTGSGGNSRPRARTGNTTADAGAPGVPHDTRRRLCLTKCSATTSAVSSSRRLS
jgi:uncharacterized protein (TIGR02996 family)